MAYPASDGKGFTNKPMARAHDARMAQQKSASPHKNATSESDHLVESSSFSCPHCGGQIDTSAIHEQRDPNAMMGGGTEF